MRSPVRPVVPRAVFCCACDHTQGDRVLSARRTRFATRTASPSVREPTLDTEGGRGHAACGRQPGSSGPSTTPLRPTSTQATRVTSRSSNKPSGARRRGCLQAERPVLNGLAAASGVSTTKPSFRRVLGRARDAGCQPAPTWERRDGRQYQSGSSVARSARASSALLRSGAFGVRRQPERPVTRFRASAPGGTGWQPAARATPRLRGLVPTGGPDGSPRGAYFLAITRQVFPLTLSVM